MYITLFHHINLSKIVLRSVAREISKYVYFQNQSKSSDMIYLQFLLVTEDISSISISYFPEKQALQ